MNPDLPKGWKLYRANEFCRSVRDGTHDSPKPSDEGWALVTSKHIKGGRVDLSSAYFISHSDYEEINRRSKVDQWDVLFSMIGTVGESCLVKEKPAFAIKNVGLFKSKDKLRGYWLYYYLQSPGGKQAVEQQLRGSTQKYIPLGELRKLPIPFPDRKQDARQLVRPLQLLDEKIELNRQTARTLEELAQRLFKSWFVDFDPVRAKMAGRQPVHMPPETAALFPEKLVDSPLGPIPEGWEFQSLDDLAEFVNGKNFTKNATGGGRMVMRIAELNSGPGGRTVWNDVETDEKHIANPGDIVFAWSGSLGVYRWYRNPALINQHIFKVIPKTGVSKAFSYQAVLGLIEEFRQIAAAKAVTMGHIKRSDLKDNGLYLPSSQDLIGAYSEIASPMWERALMLEQESETLAALRDRLLPKLISGEIRVPEALEMAEEA